jgi:hypothetical protein
VLSHDKKELTFWEKGPVVRLLEIACMHAEMFGEFKRGVGVHGGENFGVALDRLCKIF